MKLNKHLASAAVGLGALFGAASQAQAAIVTDVIMIVDESGSMGNVQTNLRNNIGLFASILAAGGIDARYGLVGYGNGAVRPRMVTDLTDATSFATAAQGLVASGGTEPGHAATSFALNSIDGQTDLFSFRSGALKNIIIFTDEQSNGDGCNGCSTGGDGSTSFSEVDNLLTQQNALFNAVLVNATTAFTYDDLAAAHGGLTFNLSLMNSTDQTVVSQFVQDFADAKLQEILDFCALNPTDPACVNNGGQVPEPGTLALLGLGAFCLRASRRMLSVAS